MLFGKFFWYLAPPGYPVEIMIVKRSILISFVGKQLWLRLPILLSFNWFLAITIKQWNSQFWEWLVFWKCRLFEGEILWLTKWQPCVPFQVEGRLVILSTIMELHGSYQNPILVVGVSHSLGKLLVLLPSTRLTMISGFHCQKSSDQWESQRNNDNISQ